MRHVLCRHWKESEFYLNCMSSLFIYTEEHITKDSSKKARFSAIFIVICHTCHIFASSLGLKICSNFEVYFASVCATSWNTFSNITHNSVIWCLNLWARVCNLRSTTRRQRYRGFVWYITGRLSVLRWLIAGLNILKMHSSSENCVEIVFISFVSNVYGKFLHWIYKWNFYFLTGSSGEIDYFFDWLVSWLDLFGFMFWFVLVFFNYSTTLPNLISGTPHPASPPPLTGILGMPTVPYIALFRCS